jgi:competence protein ComEC
VVTRWIELCAKLALAAPFFWVLSHWALLFGAAISVIWLLMREALPGRVRWLLASIVLFLVAVLRFGTAGSADEWKANSVTQLDVGQGDSALVQARGGAGLIDTGSERALGDDAWIRLLARRGVIRLKWVALTHIDEDHSGGLLRLARVLPIDCAATSRAELKTDRGQRMQRELKALGVRLMPWESGCVPYPVLGPPRNLRARGGNARMSAVLIPMEDGTRYLSMGDSDRDQEMRFAEWARSLFESGPLILKVSHHGSRFSTSPELLARLSPVRTWISDGVGNTYGHPSAQTLALLRAAQLPVERTDQSGALRAEAFRRRR